MPLIIVYIFIIHDQLFPIKGNLTDAARPTELLTY